MRQSQIVYEKILKTLIEKEPLIHAYWGYSFESLIESDDKCFVDRCPSIRRLFLP
jgi:hypothetical protein